MTPRKQSTSPLLSYLLMGGILSFGAGAAYMVLSDSSDKAIPAKHAPPTLAATPAAVRAAVTPVARPVVPVRVAAPVVAAPAVVTPIVAAPVQAAPVTAPPVITPVVAPSKPVAPAAAVVVPTQPVKPVAVPAPVKVLPPVAKHEPAAPAVHPAEVVDALRLAIPASATRASTAVAPVTAPAPATVKAVIKKPVVVEKAPSPPARAVKPARRPEAKKPVLVKAAPVKATPAPAPTPAIPVARPPSAMPLPPMPQDLSLPALKNLPKVDLPGAAAPAEAIESRPDTKPETKLDTKPTPVQGKAVASPAGTAVIEAPKPAVKSVRAAPLVPGASKPSLVMANGDKAWVKLDDQRTVIITKGQEVPGLGTFHGADKNGAKFDSGTVPLNQ